MSYDTAQQKSVLPALLRTWAVAHVIAILCWQGARAADPVIKIGLVSALTGPSSVSGKDVENGARMAVDELNEKGVIIAGKPYKIELAVQDDAGEPKQATLAAQTLVDENVNGIIGHLTSGTTIPASKIYNQAGIPQITTTSTNPQYTHQGFRYAFRMCPNDDQLGQFLGQYAVQRIQAQRIAIIDDGTAYGQGLASQFSKAAVAATKVNPAHLIVAKEQVSDKAVDFHAVLTKIKKADPEVIFLAACTRPPRRC